MRLKVMLKRNINQYNDGVLKFGKYSEKYNQDGKLLNEKEFIQVKWILYGGYEKKRVCLYGIFFCTILTKR